MADDNMQDVPEHCPGPETEMAGKSDACAGCPNQKICAESQPKGPDPDVEYVDQRMGNVWHKILVLSGKGGVGKSTVTAQLAFTLAQDQNAEVGVLDIDVCGPSIPRVMGLENEQVHQSGSGWSPIYADENLAVMSVGFLLPNPDDAVIWRGPKKNGMIKQFLKDVDWGNLDYMVVDTPPGTSDEHLSAVQYLKSTGITGAVIVTTPQEVSLIDVRKEINFCRKVNVPIIGVIENMAGFVCRKCGTETMIFPPTTGGAEAMCKLMNCELLGRLPLDPRIGQCCDEGKPFVAEHADTIAGREYLKIVERIKQVCDGEPER